MSDETKIPEDTDTAPQSNDVDWQKKADEYLNAWKRSAADFENYKKRREREDQELMSFSKQMILLKLVPVLEALEQALIQSPAEESNKVWKSGITETMNKLSQTMQEMGIERISTVGEQFNHELHEAVEMVETESPSGQIVSEVSPGYLINGHAVRPAKVKVAK